MTDFKYQLHFLLAFVCYVSLKIIFALYLLHRRRKFISLIVYIVIAICLFRLCRLVFVKCAYGNIKIIRQESAKISQRKSYFIHSVCI